VARQPLNPHRARCIMGTTVLSDTWPEAARRRPARHWHEATWHAATCHEATWTTSRSSSCAYRGSINTLVALVGSAAREAKMAGESASATVRSCSAATSIDRRAIKFITVANSSNR
jgi:hypothetical protein